MDKKTDSEPRKSKKKTSQAKRKDTTKEAWVRLDKAEA